MFLLAWLLYSVLLSQSIHTTLSAQLSATTRNDSSTVTGTWILQPGDPPQASQGFIIQLLSDEPSGEKLEDSSTVDPQKLSTGTVTLTATSTGAHRLQIVLTSRLSPLVSSSEFTIVNLDAEGTETGKSPPASTSTSQASSSVLSTSTTASELNPSSSLRTTGTSTFSTSGTTSEATQIHSTTSMPSSSESTSSSISTETKKTNLTAIIVSAILATILSIILLLAVVGLMCRRHRRRLNSTVSADPSESSTVAQQWYNSSRFKWDLQGSAPRGSATRSGTVWDKGTLSDFSTLAPSDSVSRLVSTKDTTTRWQDLKLGYRGGLFEKNLGSGIGSSTSGDMESDGLKEESTAVDGMHIRVGGPVPVIQVTSATATNSSIES